MSSFEGYHPLLTPKFRFDWLTQFRLKQVAAITDQDLAETAEWINTNMHQTMSRNALTWGIERRATHKLVGWGGFHTVDLPAHKGQAYLSGQTLPASEQQEIVDRLVNFAREELQLTVLTLKDSQNLDDAVVAAAGFEQDAQQNWRWSKH
ncbi:GNAT family N-acetyltransferase [Levilactobacillus zymae]|uniref:GNAT family acetyltransferase n=1 Tax=Levilactobacillus zymae TaxID=267363 RepID=A0A1Y6JYD2_9LACO|nr:GNAT family N-acetyltransferase [Levilactobacillus zymae]KRL11180.1 hypothetical protein FD38_GL001692 [Levilactobacillus zymae DSM 19395]QFR60078.1 N-acetyltransferase [Levilactobacillus zymae]GEO71487.1 GNAT family acetyltransferase [Levilactobacillus zymae]SMS14946.1 hypothetical protein LZ3411_1896 [Levilactobacillus zymae]